MRSVSQTRQQSTNWGWGEEGYEKENDKSQDESFGTKAENLVAGLTDWRISHVEGSNV